MIGFRRFIIQFISVTEVIVVVLATVGGGILGAIYPILLYAMTGHGAWRIIIGVVVGAFVGLFLSATAAAIFFLLAEIAANTRRTIDLLQQYNPTLGPPSLPPTIRPVQPSPTRPGSDRRFGSAENTESVRPGSIAVGDRGNDARSEGLSAVAAAISISPSAAPATEQEPMVQPEPKPISASVVDQHALDKWAALIRYDPDLASAHARVSYLGDKWTNELARQYCETESKDDLPAIVEIIVQAGIQEVLHSETPTYHKWLILITYDKELAAAHETISPYGLMWISRLADDYLAIGDKHFLAAIVASVSDIAEQKAIEEKAQKLVDRNTFFAFFVFVVALVVVFVLVVMRGVPTF